MQAGTYTETKGQSTCLPAKPGNTSQRRLPKAPEQCKPGEASGLQLMRAELWMLFRQTGARRAADSPIRATTSRKTAIERNRSRAKRAPTRRVREPTRASSAHPARTPMPRPNRSARKLKLDGASPVQKSRLHAFVRRSPRHRRDVCSRVRRSTLSILCEGRWRGGARLTARFRDSRLTSPQVRRPRGLDGADAVRGWKTH